jgi:hypothetical protein
MTRFTRGLTILTLVLAVPCGVSAADKAQFRELAAAVAETGQRSAAERLLKSLDAAPDDEFKRVYADVDLAPLIEGLSAFAAKRADANLMVGQVTAEISQALRMPRTTTELGDSPRSASFPDASYPTGLFECPFIKNTDLNRRTPDDVLIHAYLAVAAARKVIEQAQILLSLGKGIWDGISRACEQVEGVIVLGEGAVINTSLACIPVDITFAVLQFAAAEANYLLDLALSTKDLFQLCDAAVDSAELTTSYARLGHLHTDVQEVKEQLDVMQTQMQLVLKVLLESSLHQGGGARMGVDYTDRLDEVCLAAQEAIRDADELGYNVSPQAQAYHDLGDQMKAFDPKRAYEMCKRSYRIATQGGLSLR